MATDFINSNIALFGSDLEKKVKETAAHSEKEWVGVPTGDALRVWRIEKFHVVAWPTHLYGHFHAGDSYIVLKRNGTAPNYTYDLHFWLGTESSIDEKGTAAYKTVELDTFLKGVPVQFREEQSKESDLFKSYFDDLVYLPGGVESGFRHVDNNEYAGWTPKMYEIGKGVRVYDAGANVFVYEAEDSDNFARFKAAQLVYNLRSHRPRTTVMYNNHTFEFVTRDYKPTDPTKP